VFKYDGGDLREVGHYIDANGNNFWGVEQFTAGAGAPKGLRGMRMAAASDRDSGLWIFRYTGD
jgi:hypothetical protein